MSAIRFYTPNSETIPTDLRLYVDDVFVKYERVQNGFRFYVSLEDEQQAVDVVKEIVQKMIWEHDESEHGVSWRTVSLEIVSQEERYCIGTIIEWKYRIRDSY